MRFNLFTAGFNFCHQQSLNEILIFHLLHQAAERESQAQQQHNTPDFNFIFLKFNQKNFNKYFFLRINYKMREWALGWEYNALGYISCVLNSTYNYAATKTSNKHFLPHFLSPWDSLKTCASFLKFDEFIAYNYILLKKCYIFLALFLKTKKQEWDELIS